MLNKDTTIERKIKSLNKIISLQKKQLKDNINYLDKLKIEYNKKNIIIHPIDYKFFFFYNLWFEEEENKPLKNKLDFNILFEKIKKDFFKNNIYKFNKHKEPNYSFFVFSLTFIEKQNHKLLVEDNLSNKFNIIVSYYRKFKQNSLHNSIVELEVFDYLKNI